MALGRTPSEMRLLGTAAILVTASCATWGSTEAWGGAAPHDTGAPVFAAASSWVEVALFYVMDRLPALVIPGFSTYQSIIFVGGFLGMMLFYGAGKLAGSAFFRLLMPWAVGFLAVATMYLMFVSDLGDKAAARYPTKSSGSLIHHYQERGQDISEKRQRRLEQLDPTNAQD